MILGPHYRYRVRWSPALQLVQVPSAGEPYFAAQVELLVPGAWAYGWTGRWTRANRIQHPGGVEAWRVDVAWHSGWRVHEELNSSIEGVEEIGIDPLMFVTDPGWLLEYGRTLARAAAERGELSEQGLVKIADYQTRVFALAATRPCFFARWSGGAGKSLAGLCATMARPGNAIVLCPARARKEWRSEKGRSRSSAEKFTHLETHRILPVSDQPASYEPLDEYLARKREAGQRAIVVVGSESLGDHIDSLRKVGATSLIVDEVHELGSSKRVDSVVDDLGNRAFRKARTPTGDQARVLNAVDLSRFPTLAFRAGLTGTPIDKSMRRVWSQIDLLSPGGVGPFGLYRVRHCEFRLSEEGFPVDTGSSHVEELKARVAFFFSDVPRHVTHAGMKALRLDVTYLAKPDRLDVPEDERQNRPDAFAKEIQGLERAGAHARLREARKAEAASRKRRASLVRSGVVLKDGGKVVVFLARKEMVAQWATLWRSEFPDTLGWAVTGDDSEKERDRVIDAFAETDQPCWLIATGHSIGTSKDGMQCADLGIIAQLPEKVGFFLQWIWRFDRKGGKGTQVWVPIAEGTEDDVELTRITRQFGPIEAFTDSPELREIGEKLDGVDDEGLMDSIIEKVIGKQVAARDG